MAKARIVRFTARKIVTKPVKVNFKTQSGKRVSFVANKKMTKPVQVKFKAKK